MNYNVIMDNFNFALLHAVVGVFLTKWIASGLFGVEYP